MLNTLMINLNGLFVDGLESLIREFHLESAFSHAHGIEQIQTRFFNEKPDLAIFDLDSVEADEAPTYLKALAREKNRTPLLVLSNSRSVHLKQLVIAFGAASYVSKSVNRHELLSVIRANVRTRNIHRKPDSLYGRDSDDAFAPPTLRTEISADALTPRQMDVLRELAKGKSNKLIAYDLKVSENTVRNHLSAVFRVLRAKNRTEALCQATRLQIVSTEQPADPDRLTH